MTNDEIREIIQVLMETGVAELEVQRGENRVWVKRAQQEMQPVAAPVIMTAAAPQPMPMYTPQQAVASQPKQEEKLPVIPAPIVGTFYESPSPGAASFVKPGDTVQPGQVL